MEKKTRSQIMADDVAALLRARNPLLWITTREESRVERYLFAAANVAKYSPRTWDIGNGVRDIKGLPTTEVDGVDPSAAFDAVLALANDASQSRSFIWVMRDLPIWLTGQPGARPLRQLRNLARRMPFVPQERAQAIVVLSPSGNVPDELAGHATVLEWPLPDRDEIAALLDATIKGLRPERQAEAALTPDMREKAIDAALGLTEEEANACYAKSLVQFRKIDPVEVSKEKKRVVSRERVLEWFDPIEGGLDAVGGLENLKEWLRKRLLAYSKEARDYGLPTPKGTLLGGIQGCGKSMMAKAIATAFEMPLLRLDMGALRSKFVGESEANIRKALRVIEAIGRCVVWMDEVEKALQGSTSGSADGGVSTDALGTVLTWMQERQGAAFVVATANDVDALPPEFLRKGRFDELFWVDLPTESEKVAILETTLRRSSQAAQIEKLELREISIACRDFTGAEVASIIPEAMFTAFADNRRPITTADLLAAAEDIYPLAKTASEKFQALRKWSVGRMKPASKTEQEIAALEVIGGRAIEL